MTTASSRRTAAVAVFAAALVALAGCSSSGTSGDGAAGGAQPAAGSGPATSSAAVITIKDFSFATPASVGPGAKVTVRNMDDTAHTVTADDGHAFDSPAPTGNSSFTAPTTPGSYSFHCSIHPEMHGTLVVK